MSELEYVSWRGMHFCPSPPIHDVDQEASLKVGTEWTCPECSAHYVVADIGRTGLDWITFGPRRSSDA